MVGKFLVGLARAGVHAAAIRQAQKEAQLEALRAQRRARGRRSAQGGQTAAKAPCSPCAAKAYAGAMFQVARRYMGG